MKRTTIAFLMILCIICASAQTKDSIDVSKFTAGYYFVTNTTDKEGNAVCDTLHTVLMFGGNVTKTMGYYTHKYKILNEDKREYYVSTSVKAWHMCQRYSCHLPTRRWKCKRMCHLITMRIRSQETFNGHCLTIP